ncbi:hypothetical protein BDK51DRAFT_32183, partial [Blyttiomyces helicus]
EKSAWRHAQRHAGELEVLAERLQDNAESFEFEARSLRRQNEGLESRLDKERIEHAEDRQRWLEREVELFNVIKAQKAKVKERFVAPPTKLLEENAELYLRIDTLTAHLSQRESEVARQEDMISELQQTVGALMDELERGRFDVDHFEPATSGSSDLDALSAVDAGAPFLTPPKTPEPSEAAAQPAAVPPRRRRTSSAAAHPLAAAIPPVSTSAPFNALAEIDAKSAAPQAGAGLDVLSPGIATPRSFGSLAEELSRLGVPVHHGSANEPGALREKLAQYGLSTDGNRKILKRRLEKYLAKKKR